MHALGTGDVPAVRAFFQQVPEGDRTFFREDVLRPGAIEGWLCDARQHRLLAIVDGRVAGMVAVLPGVAWSSHVAELRLVVAPEHRRRGLGRVLAQRALVEADQLGITKLVVEVVAAQESTVGMFVGLGFEPEGLLKDHVRTRAGQFHDLTVLSHFVEALAATLATGIGDVELDGG